MLFEALLAVFVKEELRILKAGAQNALIAVLNGFEVLFAAIADRDEERHQAAVSGLDREITLMVTHRRDNSLSRQLKILVFKLAAKCRRILDEIENLFEQVLGNLSRAAICFSDFFNLLADHSLALILIDEDEVFLAGLFVAVGICNLKIALRQETMTAGRAARFDLSNLKRDDFVIEQCDNPTQRADELEVKVSPAHVVWERQTADEVLQEVLQ